MQWVNKHVQAHGIPVTASTGPSFVAARACLCARVRVSLGHGAVRHGACERAAARAAAPRLLALFVRSEGVGQDAGLDRQIQCAHCCNRDPRADCCMEILARELVLALLAAITRRGVARSRSYCHS